MFGLQFSDLYARIQKYANTKSVEGSATEAKKAANDALRLIASMRNWEILKRESSITPIASTQAYAILTGTTDFDRIISCWYLSNGVPIPIDVVDDDKWQQQVLNTTDGTPAICRVTIVDGTLKLQLSPRPSGSFISLYTTVYFDYVKNPTELSADTDVPNIPNTSQQMAIVYFAVSDLLAGQGDINGMGVYEAKGTRLLNAAHRIDDKKQGRNPRFGRPLIPINSSRGIRISDYN